MSLRVHPARSEADQVEVPWIYDRLIDTFFRHGADYIFEADDQVGIVRFTHVPTGNYVIMARNTQFFGRPDLVLPWGCMRVRYMPRDDTRYRFAVRILNDAEMLTLLEDRTGGNPNSVNAVTVQFMADSNFQSVVWNHTLHDTKTFTALRELQYTRVNAIAAANVSRHDEQNSDDGPTLFDDEPDELDRAIQNAISLDNQKRAATQQAAMPFWNGTIYPDAA